MLSAQDYLELVRSRGERGLELSRIYRNIQRTDLFLMAYQNLYANQGATTPGTDPADTIDGMSMAKVEKVIQRLENGTFAWKPARRVYIDKAGGKKRPLGIPSWTDKLVQEVLRMVLEAYYEPQFSSLSHGFRPGRGCHTALGAIVRTWHGTRWFIEGDIKGCFDHIDHDVLITILEKKIKDNRIIRLIRQMLQAGYLEGWKYHGTFSGTPQGGVISPLLANIYLNELDQYVETVLMPKYTRGKRRRGNPVYRHHLGKQLRAQRRGDRLAWQEHHKKAQQLASVDPFDPTYRRLKYIRYADDFILGFAGPKCEAEEIKLALQTFLTGLKLELSEEKTLITHATSEQARFLGYDVTIAQDDGKRTRGERSINGVPMLRVPAEVRREWLARHTKKGKAASRNALIRDTDYDIVVRYEVELRGLVNYYQMAVNASKLYQVKSAMMASLAKTLATKYRRSVAWVYKRYKTTFDNGLVGMAVTVDREGKRPLVAKFGATPIRYQREALLDDMAFPPYREVDRRSQLVERLLAETCELCGASGPVEVHHIRKLKDVIRQYRRKEKPVWVVTMVAIRRKTLIVCRACHTAIHHGTYDGRKLA